MAHLIVVLDILAPLEGDGRCGTGGNLKEEVILNGVGLGAAFEYCPVGVGAFNGKADAGFGIFFFELIGPYLEEVFLVGSEVGGIGNFGGEDLDTGFGGGELGLVIDDYQFIGFGILVHVPAEGNILTGCGIYLYGEVLRLEAALEGQFGDFLELFLGAANGHERQRK